MAVMDFGVEHTTTYKAGNDILITFKWIRYNINQHGDKMLDFYYKGENGLDTVQIPVESVFSMNRLVYVTDMIVSGSGYTFDNYTDFMFDSTTDAYTQDYIDNKNGSLTYPKCAYYVDAQVYNIYEIKFSNFIKNIPYGMFTYIRNEEYDVNFTYAVNKLNIYAEIEYTGKSSKINGTYMGEELNQYNDIERTHLRLFGVFPTNNYDPDIHPEFRNLDDNSIYEINLNCSKLKHIGSGTFTYGVNRINELTDIEIIEPLAFYKYNIEEIDLGNNIEFIGDRAFYRCESLRKFNSDNYINGTVQGIIFYRCVNIEELHLGENLIYLKTEYIQEGANDCTSLLYIRPGEGSCLYNGIESDYQGWQVLSLTDDRIDKETHYINWSNGYIYVGEPVVSTGFLEIQSTNKVIMIKSYSDGDMEIAVGDQIKRVKLVELTDASASPVEIAVGNKIMALKF